MKKVILAIVIIVVVIIAGAASYVNFALPDVGAAPELKIDITPERIQHGKYLANHVTVCMDCHSTRDWSQFSAPIQSGTLGKGGELFNEKMGFPGTIYSKNITPSNLKSWTDGEIFRVITTGVDKNGDALFPVMPYPYYGRMDKEDIYDIIAYVRSLAPIEHKNPIHALNFPVNFIVNTIPAKAKMTNRPPVTDTLQYGAYMINAAGCMECHTPVKNGQVIPEKAFIGGREFEMPNGVIRSANLTPDNETGLGNWTAEVFLARFKAYSNQDSLPPMAENTINTIMPWVMYAGMDSTDLVAIFKYLQTLKPVHNAVMHFEKKEGMK